MKPDRLATLLELADQGARAADIAATLGTSVANVYYLLRKHRRDRARAWRINGFNETRFKIAGLLSAGHPPGRVAKVVGVSRAYVYRVQGEVRP